MKYRLRTTIGNVSIGINGYVVHVSTEHEECRNISIDTRNQQSGPIGRQSSIDQSFDAAMRALREYFPTILALGVIDFQAPLTELMQSEVFRKFGSHPLAGARW